MLEPERRRTTMTQRRLIDVSDAVLVIVDMQEAFRMDTAPKGA